jgi:dedicator of cytokinesis protein 3
MGSPLIGVTTEEASVIRPVSVRHRGARLSFLGGKKKDLDLPPEVEEITGDAETASNHSRSLSHSQSRDNHRHSFFRTQSGDEKNHGGFSSRRSLEVVSPVEEKPIGKENIGGGGGLVKKNSVRKRFSMLKLGRKTSKNTMMGSLDEE